MNLVRDGLGWLIALGLASTPMPTWAQSQQAPILEPIMLRVGLATDLPSLSVPWNSTPLVAESSDGVVARLSSLRIEPAAEILSPGIFRLQAAALKDEGQARGLAQQLQGSLEEPADVVFDAGSDLYRVRVGRFASRAEAEQAQGRLALRGLSQSWVVSEKGELGKAEFRLTQGEKSFFVSGRWLSLRNGDGGGVRVLEGIYRGRVLVFLNDRGLLNVINELPVEEYLRGVVPQEMGPEVYDSLEALKAQTVAARTYTLRNLGEFADEGYDICATPRCQVYGGMSAEHALADRAIRETVGQALVYDGKLVDALYSSTCGGHTEDVQVVFPLKDEPYLKGVACLESGLDRIVGNVPDGTPFPHGLMLRVLPVSGVELTTASVGARMEHLALMAGLPIPHDQLASLERREVQRFIASVYDLALDVRLFVAPEDLIYLLNQPPPDWSERELRLAAYLIKSGLLAGDLDEPLTAGEIDEILFRLALHLRVLDRVDGRFLGLEAGVVSIRGSDAGIEEYRLSEHFGTYRLNSRHREASPLTLLAGDRVALYLHSQQVVAVTHEADTDGVAFDRTSQHSSWTRFRTDAELARLVDIRYPGLGFESFEILERGVSGRVGKIRLIGESGRSVEVEGLAVRWTFDLPDTLFTAKRLTPPGRAAGWLFAGRGWGHGVGLCQVGAFGMAQRGHSYRSILQHYYSGVQIARVSMKAGAARRWSE